MRVDVVQLAADVMAQRGYPVVRRDGLLEHPDSGFAITPVLLDTYPAGPLVHSTTTVTTSHPRLVPQGVFEYQHARDKTLADAVRDGFDQWVQLDFAVLLDALRDPLEYCQGIEITFPQIDGPDLRRRACPRSDRTCCPVPGMSGSRRRASLLPVLLPDQHIRCLSAAHGVEPVLWNSILRGAGRRRCPVGRLPSQRGGLGRRKARVAWLRRQMATGGARIEKAIYRDADIGRTLIGLGHYGAQVSGASRMTIDESERQTPPSSSRVAARAIALVAVVSRGFIEVEQDRREAQRRRLHLSDWVERVGR